VNHLTVAAEKQNTEDLKVDNNYDYELYKLIHTKSYYMAAVEDRGFASMDPERQREIASKGGKAAHERGTAHEWTSEEAREAGRKGGKKVSENREHMSEIGRKGGQA